jgi:hypothetical protein
MKQMSTYTDNCGTVFSTTHGQAPAVPQNVTTHQNGQTGQGWWNGSQVVKY